MTGKLCSPLAILEPYDPFKDPEKARKREGWPIFEVPTRAEIGKVAMLRGLSPEGVALVVERGLLFCTDTGEGRTWVIADSAAGRTHKPEGWTAQVGAH